MKKEIKKLENSIESILIDFGNHYSKATQGRKLDLKFYRNQIMDLIEREKKVEFLEATIDAKNFVEEIGLTEDLLPVFKTTIKDLQEDLTPTP